jgi:hypothetical protein
VQTKEPGHTYLSTHKSHKTLQLPSQQVYETPPIRLDSSTVADPFLTPSKLRRSSMPITHSPANSFIIKEQAPNFSAVLSKNGLPTPPREASEVSSNRSSFNAQARSSGVSTEDSNNPASLERTASRPKDPLPPLPPTPPEDKHTSNVVDSQTASISRTQDMSSETPTKVKSVDVNGT